MADEEPKETEITGAAETTDAGTEGLETISMADGSTDHATPDVPPTAEPNPTADSSEGGPEATSETDAADTPKTDETATAEEKKPESPLDRIFDIGIGALVVAVEATRQAAEQVRDNGPEVAKHLEEKGRPIREKLAAQIKERGFGPSTLPLLDPDGTDPTAPPVEVSADTPAPEETSEATSATPAPSAEPVKPAVVLAPGSSAADAISLLERRARELESQVEPLDPTRLNGDPDGPEDGETPAESGTYVPGELDESKAELEAVPQFEDSPYAVSETETEQEREDNPFRDEDETKPASGSGA